MKDMLACDERDCPASSRAVSRGVLEIADREVTIPMAAAVDSLNVAAAAAVLLYELGGR